MAKKRGVLVILASALLATLSLVPVAGTAQAVTLKQEKVWATNQCLDNAAEDAHRMQVWTCNGGTTQAWEEIFDPAAGTFSFKNARSKMCLAVTGFNLVVEGQTCTGSSSQKWTVFFADNPLGPPTGWYDVWKNVLTGLCLFVPNPNLPNGTGIETTDCNAGTAAQRWHTADR